MSTRLQIRSRNDRIVTIVSVIWCVASVVLALFIMKDDYLEAHEFLLLLIVFLSPVLIYWSVKWIRSGEKSEKQLEKEKIYDDLLRQQPDLVVSKPLNGIGNKIHFLTLFTLLMIAGFVADFFINQYMIDQAYTHGWGNIPKIVISNVETWSLYSMYLRGAAGIGFLIVVAIGYTDIKLQLERIGIEGIRCSVGMLALWLIIPFVNIVVPWRVFGALDRATKFAAIRNKAGSLWNEKGHKGLSLRAMGMGVMFVVTGISATLYIKELASIAARTPYDVYGFVRIIRQNNELLIGMAVVYTLFMASIWIYFFYLNRNLSLISYEKQRAPSIADKTDRDNVEDDS